MPRVYNGDNDPLDFCRFHFPSESKATFQHGRGEGPDGRGNCFAYDAEHPPYQCETYKCKVCRAPLTENDN